MLNYVIYIVTDAGHQYLADKSAEMKKMLNAAGIELLITGCGKEERPTSMDKKGLLVISDSTELVREMTDEGFCVTGFYHSKNRDKIFEGVSYAVDDVEELTIRSYEDVYCRLAGIPWDILETERLQVRESTVGDVVDFYRIYSEPSITDYVEALFVNPDEERAYMEDYISHMYGFYGFGMWTVIEKNQGRIIGRAGLDTREGYDLPELGFVIEKSYQRRGYAEEVCRAILAYAKKELLFDKVQALTEEANTASVNLLAKLGFVYQREVSEKGKKYCFMTKEL